MVIIASPKYICWYMYVLSVFCHSKRTVYTLIVFTPDQMNLVNKLMLRDSQCENVCYFMYCSNSNSSYSKKRELAVVPMKIGDNLVTYTADETL